MIVGSTKRRPETGETAVCIAEPDGDFKVLSQTLDSQLTDRQWPAFMQRQSEKITAIDRVNRDLVSKGEQDYWTCLLYTSDAADE